MYHPQPLTPRFEPQPALWLELDDIPPFFKTDMPVPIGIHFGEELVEVAVRDRKTRSPQRNP
jgi:hypothetical protein